MSLFVECIQQQIAVARQGQRRGVKKLGRKGFDISTLVGALAAIDDPGQARAFYDGYMAWMVETFGQSPEEAEKIAKANIGWCFGEGLTPTQVRLWREATGAQHPAGRIEEMTPEEIFEAGMRLGRESRA